MFIAGEDYRGKKEKSLFLSFIYNPISFLIFVFFFSVFFFSCTFFNNFQTTIFSHFPKETIFFLYLKDKEVFEVFPQFKNYLSSKFLNLNFVREFDDIGIAKFETRNELVFFTNSKNNKLPKWFSCPKDKIFCTGKFKNEEYFSLEKNGFLFFSDSKNTLLKILLVSQGKEKSLKSNENFINAYENVKKSEEMLYVENLFDFFDIDKKAKKEIPLMITKTNQKINGFVNSNYLINFSPKTNIFFDYYNNQKYNLSISLQSKDFWKNISLAFDKNKYFLDYLNKTLIEKFTTNIIFADQFNLFIANSNSFLISVDLNESDKKRLLDLNYFFDTQSVFGVKKIMMRKKIFLDKNMKQEIGNKILKKENGFYNLFSNWKKNNYKEYKSPDFFRLKIRPKMIKNNFYKNNPIEKEKLFLIKILPETKKLELNARLNMKGLGFDIEYEK